MATSFSVDVRLQLLNQLSSGLRGLQTGLSSAQTQVDSLGRSFSQLFAFRELEQSGKKIVGFVGSMASHAMDLQSAMINVGTATGASVQQMKQMHDLVMSTSQAGLMTSAEAGNMAAQLARAGFDPRQLQALLPTIAKFGDLMNRQRGMTFEASADFGAEIAHYYRAYDEKTAAPIIETVAKVMQMSLGTPQQLFTQLQKFGSLAGFGGMSPEKQLQLAAMGMNLGDKAFGTGIQNIILGSIGGSASLSANRESHQRSGLEALGLMDKSGHNLAWQGGHLNMDFIMSQLVKRSGELPADQFALAVTNAFNRRGGKTAMTMADKAILDRLAQMPAEFAKRGSLDQMHSAIMDGGASQWQLLISNITNVGTALGEGMLPATTKLSASLAVAAGSTADYINSHMQLKKALGIGALGLGGLGAGAVAVGGAGVAFATMRIMANAFRSGALPVTVVNGSALGLGTGAGGTGGSVDLATGAVRLAQTAILAWKAGRAIGEAGGDDWIQKKLGWFLDNHEAWMNADAQRRVQENVDKRRESEQMDKLDKRVETIHAHLHVNGRELTSAILKPLSNAAKNTLGPSRSGSSISPYSSNNKGQ